MDPAQHYGRTPLPQSVRVPMALAIPLWLAVIFSPFVAFAVNGVVDDSNWTPAFVTAGVSLLLLTLLHARAAANYAQLPKALREEYRSGKLYPATRRPSSYKDRTFGLGSKRAVVMVSQDGVRFSLGACLRADFRHATGLAKLMSAHHGQQDKPLHFVAWRDIEAWEVRDDSEGPDYYRLGLAKGGYLCVRRPSIAQDEQELLDAVRGVGQTAVRLLCDMPR